MTKLEMAAGRWEPLGRSFAKLTRAIGAKRSGSAGRCRASGIILAATIAALVGTTPANAQTGIQLQNDPQNGNGDVQFRTNGEVSNENAKGVQIDTTKPSTNVENFNVNTEGTVPGNEATGILVENPPAPNTLRNTTVRTTIAPDNDSSASGENAVGVRVDLNNQPAKKIQDIDITTQGQVQPAGNAQGIQIDNTKPSTNVENFKVNTEGTVQGNEATGVRLENPTPQNTLRNLNVRATGEVPGDKSDEEGSTKKAAVDSEEGDESEEPSAAPGSGTGGATPKQTVQTSSGGQTGQSSSLAVDVPWKIVGKLKQPSNGASITCNLIDSQCNPGSGQGVPVGVNAGVGVTPSNGTQTITFSGAEVTTAVGITCELRAPGMKSDVSSTNTRPIPGRFAACMVNEGGQWKALDLVEMQKRGAAFARNRAAQIDADRKAYAARKAAEDSADRTAQAANKRLADAARQRAIAAAVKAAADAARKEFMADYAALNELQGHTFNCTRDSECRQEKPKGQFGGVGPSNRYDWYGYCRKDPNANHGTAQCVGGPWSGSIDTNGSACIYNVQCSNEKYQGICHNNKCVASDRGEKCADGQRKKCHSLIGDPTGRISGLKDGVANGVATCVGGAWSDCAYSKQTHNNSRNEERRFQAKQKSYESKLVSEKVSTSSKLTNATYCNSNADCNNQDSVGVCVAADKPISGGSWAQGQTFAGRCKSTQRESCSDMRKGALERCINSATGEYGHRICQPNDLKSKKYSRCMTTEEMDGKLTTPAQYRKKLQNIQANGTQTSSNVSN